MIRITDSIRPLLACTIALTGAAVAGTAYPNQAAFIAADGDVSNSLSKVEFATTLGEEPSEKVINKSFKKADADKDESISLSEFLVFEADSKKEGAFIKADADLNGVVSLDEYVAATQGKAPYIVVKKRFLLSDSDDEGSVGVLTLTEWSAKRRKPTKGEFLSFDLANEETVETPLSLTVAEFAGVLPKNTTEEKVQARFDKLDDNEDGFLTKDEWNPGAPKTPAS